MGKTINLSAVILSRDEEKNIKRALNSISFCDEIIVIDDYSEDNTVKIAKDQGAVVYQRKLNGDFSSQRNFAQEKCLGEWILYIDADEEVTHALAKEIKEIIKGDNKQNTSYYIKRRDFWWGKELKFGELKKARQKGLIRLVKRNSGSWMGNVHEVFHTSNSSYQLKSFLNHYPHPTLKEFINDINIYSTLRAKELSLHGKSSNIFEIILFPSAKFFLNYIINLGFIDGPAGFAYAFLMSFHSFLVRVKLYQYTKMDKES